MIIKKIIISSAVFLIATLSTGMAGTVEHLATGAGKLVYKQCFYKGGAPWISDVKMENENVYCTTTRDSIAFLKHEEEYVSNAVNPHKNYRKSNKKVSIGLFRDEKSCSSLSNTGICNNEFNRNFVEHDATEALKNQINEMLLDNNCDMKNIKIIHSKDGKKSIVSVKSKRELDKELDTNKFDEKVNDKKIVQFTCDGDDEPEDGKKKQTEVNENIGWGSWFWSKLFAE